MANKLPLLVKFVPWNENTLASLINKTVKFSTVLELNDFNEYRYLSQQAKGSDHKKELDGIIKEKLKNAGFQNNLAQLLDERGSEEITKDIKGFLKEGNLDSIMEKEDYWPTLVECLAFSSVGIFCTSHIDVFQDERAAIMFAHYAQNLKGLALVYKCNLDKVLQVRYKDDCQYSDGSSERILDWDKGIYNSDCMADFRCKYREWGYENEQRLFAKPGIHEASEHGIELKAIFYTARFAGVDSTLKRVNADIYSYDTLDIKRIYPGQDKGIFRISKEESAYDFLKKKYFK